MARCWGSSALVDKGGFSGKAGKGAISETRGKAQHSCGREEASWTSADKGCIAEASLSLAKDGSHMDVSGVWSASSFSHLPGICNPRMRYTLGVQ